MGHDDAVQLAGGSHGDLLVEHILGDRLRLTLEGQRPAAATGHAVVEHVAGREPLTNIGGIRSSVPPARKSRLDEAPPSSPPARP